MQKVKLNQSFLRNEFSFSKKLLAAAMYLSKSSFKSHHLRNRLGAFWVTIHGLVFLIFLTVLRHLFFGIESVSADIARIFVCYSIFGTLVLPLRDGAGFLLRNRAYFEGTNLPVSFFLIKTFFDSCRSLFYSWLLVPIVIFWSGLKFNFVQAPVLIMWLFFYILLYWGISIWLAPLILRFPDVEQLTQSIITAALFITPIWWNLESLDSIFARQICSLNPFYWGIRSIENIFLGGQTDYDNLIKFVMFAVANFIIGTIALIMIKRKFLYWYD